MQDQVTWAQEVEQTYSLRNELSVTRQQMAEMQKKLVDAEDIIGDIRKRVRYHCSTECFFTFYQIEDTFLRTQTYCTSGLVLPCAPIIIVKRLLYTQ